VRALVLAGRSGAALGPVGERGPVASMPTGGLPLVVRAIQGLSAAGVDEVFVAVPEHAERDRRAADGAHEDRATTDAFHARTRSLATDLCWLARGAVPFVTRRAWRPAPRRRLPARAGSRRKT
jgi:hypothetical protein